MTAALSDLQALFQSRLMAGDGTIDAHLAGGGPFMGVYAHAYKARLVEVLGDEFEGVRALLGEDAFDATMRGYLDAHPSEARSARWIGRHLSAWLSEKVGPEAASMAAFEWALSLAFDAPDAMTAGFADIAAVPPEAWPLLTFTFHPSLGTFVLTHDVAAFKTDGQASARFDAPQDWAAWRDAETLSAMYRRLDLDEAAMLKAAMAGATFDALCETVACHGDADAAAMRAAVLLRRWVETGWIAGVDAEGMSW